MMSFSFERTSRPRRTPPAAASRSFETCAFRESGGHDERPRIDARARRKAGKHDDG